MVIVSVRIYLTTTITKTYPSQSQSIPNLTNSFNSFGMYICTITYPIILIASHTTIFNSPIISFCSLDTTLILTSANFHSILPPSLPLLPPSYLAPTLVALIQNSLMMQSLQIYSLLLPLFSTVIPSNYVSFCPVGLSLL